MKSERSKISYKVQGRIWIESDKGPFLGFGRVDLLKKIKEYGSISGAAKSMKMSYRHAWHLIESMNEKTSTPLVVSQTGGKGGGGARLTEAGEKVIKSFDKLDQDFIKFIKAQTTKFKI